MTPHRTGRAVGDVRLRIIRAAGALDEAATLLRKQAAVVEAAEEVMRIMEHYQCHDEVDQRATKLGEALAALEEK